MFFVKVQLTIYLFLNIKNIVNFSATYLKNNSKKEKVSLNNEFKDYLST
jgi:hypothetical protein